MIRILLLAIFSVTISNSFGQLDKRVWLVGGTGSLLTTKTETYSNYIDVKANVLNINIQPNIGYFVADKLAFGLRPSYILEKAKITETNGTNGGSPYNETRFSVGPFVRYYFLQSEKPFNLLADVNYSPGIYSSKPEKGNFSTFTASVGPVIYFNSSVGLEFLLGY